MNGDDAAAKSLRIILVGIKIQMINAKTGRRRIVITRETRKVGGFDLGSAKDFCSCCTSISTADILSFLCGLLE